MSKFSRGNKGRSKLTAMQVFSLRKEWADGAPQRYLSAKYGVTSTTIYNIVYGLTWKGLPTVASEDQIAFEVAQSLSRLDAALETTTPADVGLTPEEIERLNRKLMEPDMEAESTTARADIDEMFRRRSGQSPKGQPNDQDERKGDSGLPESDSKGT